MENAQNLQEDNYNLEFVKHLLDWCYENEIINKIPKNGDQTNRDNLLHWACQNGHTCKW